MCMSKRLIGNPPAWSWYAIIPTSRYMKVISANFALTDAMMELSLKAHYIVAVYTQPPRPAGRGQKDTPSPVFDYATTHGLKVLTSVSLKSPEVQAEFAAHKADAAIVAAYGLLLPKPILTAYRLGCLNV